MTRGSRASYTAETLSPGPGMTWAVPGQNLGCDSVDISGNITPGATVSKAGPITTSEFNGCVLWLGINQEWTQTGTWDINIVGDNSSGVTPAKIDNVSIHTENPDGLCVFDVTGTVDGSFNANNQQLSVSGGRLTVSNVDQCYGLILERDPMKLDMTLQLDDIETITNG